MVHLWQVLLGKLGCCSGSRLRLSAAAAGRQFLLRRCHPRAGQLPAIGRRLPMRRCWQRLWLAPRLPGRPCRCKEVCCCGCGSGGTWLRLPLLLRRLRRPPSSAFGPSPGLNRALLAAAEAARGQGARCRAASGGPAPGCGVCCCGGRPRMRGSLQGYQWGS